MREKRQTERQRDRETERRGGGGGAEVEREVEKVRGCTSDTSLQAMRADRSMDLLWKHWFNESTSCLADRTKDKTQLELADFWFLFFVLAIFGAGLVILRILVSDFGLFESLEMGAGGSREGFERGERGRRKDMPQQAMGDRADHAAATSRGGGGGGGGGREGGGGGGGGGVALPEAAARAEALVEANFRDWSPVEEDPPALSPSWAGAGWVSKSAPAELEAARLRSFDALRRGSDA